MPMKPVLDHIEGLQIQESEADHHFDELMALSRLGEGLWWLYREVIDWERKLRREAAPEDVRIAISGGILADKPMGILSCAFQWYAVSACNYAQLAGWLATKDTKSAKEYVRKVMPRIRNYRNKVAAHFALTAPYASDNPADLAASVMTHIVYLDGRLCAASLSPMLDNGESKIVANHDLSWSLTIAHERLMPRYWPDGPPTSYQSIRVPPGTTTLKVSWSDLVGNGT